MIFIPGIAVGVIVISEEKIRWCFVIGIREISIRNIINGV